MYIHTNIRGNCAILLYTIPTVLIILKTLLNNQNHSSPFDKAIQNLKIKIKI